ncbi:reverse transcriptase domain-containing protein [Tanacetum coccineum]
MTSPYPTPPFTVPSPSESSFSIPTTSEPVFSVATTEPVFESQTSHSAQPSQNTQPQFQQYNSTTVSSIRALLTQQLSDVAELKDMVSDVLSITKITQTQAPAPIKAVEQWLCNLRSNTIANPKGGVKAITIEAVFPIMDLKFSLIPPKEKELNPRPFDWDPIRDFNFGDTKTLSYNIIESVNRVDVIDIACEEYVQEVLEISESGNPTSTSDLTIDSRSPSFTPFGGSDFLMEEIDAFLEHDDSIPPGVDGIYDSEGDTVYLEELLSVINSDPNLPPSPVCEINVPEKVKSFNVKIPRPWLIYPISDSPWVSPVHCVPKKGGITVVKNEENELIPTRLVTGWRVCIDYRKLNDATRKDHFPLPFMDQMLERLAGNEYYCFLDGFSGYFQIPIDPLDQEKTTFTCPYGTFAYRRMPFGLCNAPGTFQRCMVAIFHDMIEKTMEVFMDDFSVFGDSFSSCLSHLDKMLQRCEDTNLVLNWEKCHFMVKEGIVLGHKISKSGIEVDKAKVDVIAKLPHPTTVKGIRSFLGHAGFYR